MDNAVGELWQPVNIPTGANPVRLTFWWMPEVDLEQPGDILNLLIQHGGVADQLRTFGAVAPVRVWRREIVDLTPYAGMMVSLTFRGSTDGTTPTTFRLDDVTLEVCGAPTSTPTATGSAVRTPTPTRTPGGSRFTFSIDPDLHPEGGPLPPIGDRPPRPLSVVRGPDGRDDFAAGEVVLYSEVPGVLEDFLARYEGEVLLGDPMPAPPAGLGADQIRRSYDHAHFSLLRVNLARADLSDFVAWMEELGFEGHYAFSSEDAVRLSAIIAKERVVNHLEVSPDMPTYPDSPDCVMCETEERSTGSGLYEDAFGESWFNDTGLQVSRAWQYFDLLQLSTRPDLAIIDSGFSLSADFPSSGISMYDFVQEDYDALGKSGSWHGTGSLSTAAALLNNRFGTASTGGQAALPMLFRISDVGKASMAVQAWALNTAIYWGADVVNISYSGYCSSWCNWVSGVNALKSAASSAAAAGVVVVASAGNDETDRTTTQSLPCETVGTICVGAIDTASKQAVRNTTHGWGSNYGEPGTDIWAPGDHIHVTSNPESAGKIVDFNGTSAASPYVAGIVTLMKAIQPGMTEGAALSVLQGTANSPTDSRVNHGYINAYKAIKQVAANAGVKPKGDKYESNNTEATAYKLLGSSTHLTATIAPGDLDYFVVDLTDYMDAELSVAYNDGRTTGNELTAKIDSTTGARTATLIQANAERLAPGKHYIMVKGTTSDSMNCYQLWLDLTEATIDPDDYDDETPAGEPRNDTFAVRAVITDVNLQATGFSPLVEIEDLNFDTSTDVDFFEAEIPAVTDPKTGRAECITPPTGNSKFVQGYMEILAYPDGWKPQYPGVNWPFVVRAYDTSGTEFTSYKSKSSVGLTIECPHQYAAFSSDDVRWSVASKDGRRNYYRAFVYFHRYFDYAEPNVPDWVWTLTQPPKIRVIPPAGWLNYVFPWDQEVIERYFAGTIIDPLPAGYAIFQWQRAGALNLWLTAQAGKHIAITLYGINQEVLGHTEVGGAAAQELAPSTSMGHIHVPDLPAGTYAVAVQGDFGANFGVRIGSRERTYLPVVLRTGGGTMYR